MGKTLNMFRIDIAIDIDIGIDVEARGYRLEARG